MIARIAAAGLLVSLAVPVAAQRVTVPQPENELRKQVRTFESVLQRAAHEGAAEVAQKVANVMPNAPPLMLTQEPQARGFKLTGQLFFEVSVPGLSDNSAWIISQQMAAPRPRPASPATQASGVVTGTTTLADEPFDVEREYILSLVTQFKDAMLDYSGPLELAANERLTVAARNGDDVPSSVAYDNYGYVTYLEISGADLLAYKAGKLSKDEARKKIAVWQF